VFIRSYFTVHVMPIRYSNRFVQRVDSNRFVLLKKVIGV